MERALQITFRNLDRSAGLESEIRRRANKLERLYDGIVSCRVVVEAQHKHHAHGNHYHVRVDVSVPGDELVASREPDENQAYTDAYVAIRDAFDSMRRQLEGYAQSQQGRVKAHAGSG